jgi:hypothetical protein
MEAHERLGGVPADRRAPGRTRRPVGRIAGWAGGLLVLAWLVQGIVGEGEPDAAAATDTVTVTPTVVVTPTVTASAPTVAGDAEEVWVTPTVTVPPQPPVATPQPSPAQPTSAEGFVGGAVEPTDEDAVGGGATHYRNCSAARAAGAAPVMVGDPGYGRHLDRDGDGSGCEN